MRVYKLQWFEDYVYSPDTNPSRLKTVHIDLDHILAISEPFLESKSIYAFTITFAFRDTPIFISSRNGVISVDRAPAGSKHFDFHQIGPVLKDGEPEAQVYLTEIFKKLYKEWAGKEYE